MDSQVQIVKKSLFLLTKFFVTSGKAVSSTSALNAFDAALAAAGIAQCNIVTVSSILPSGAEQIDPIEIPPGTITFCVMARMDGESGETIGAGIGWGWGEGIGVRYGLVAEAHGYKDKEATRRELCSKLQEMAKIRKLELRSFTTLEESMEVSKGKYGSVVVALVYLPQL
ncbi:MAG: pyruvoyl-dependent arginine decarboxylase [Thermoproteota archaeon]